MTEATSRPYAVSRRGGEPDSDAGLVRDVAFNRHSMQDGEHISPFPSGAIQVGTDELVVRLVQGIDEDAFKKTLSRATLATIGIPVDGDEPDDDWEEMLRGGLQTALETQVVVFEVWGTSRTCTHQLVRSRRAAFHQSSQRASFLGDQPEVRMPDSVFQNDRAREAFMVAVDKAHEAYRIACDEDISYQDARFVLPEGTTTYILLEYPIREFLNVYAYRACSMFQWEIAKVMRECRKVLVEAHPWLDEYVKITCEKTGVCEFQGWETVEGQCAFPWAREDNRRYTPSDHLKITRK